MDNEQRFNYEFTLEDIELLKFIMDRLQHACYLQKEKLENRDSFHYSHPVICLAIWPPEADVRKLVATAVTDEDSQNIVNWTNRQLHINNRFSFYQSVSYDIYMAISEKAFSQPSHSVKNLLKLFDLEVLPSSDESAILIAGIGRFNPEEPLQDGPNFFEYIPF